MKYSIGEGRWVHFYAAELSTHKSNKGQFQHALRIVIKFSVKFSNHNGYFFSILMSRVKSRFNALPSVLIIGNSILCMKLNGI